MSTINYDGRVFVGIENYDDGDFNRETVFHYRQEGDVVWGTFRGGGVALGTFVATADARGCLDMRWSYVSKQGQLRTGECRSIPELGPANQRRLREHWRTTNGVDDAAGESVIEEVARTEEADKP